MTTFADWEAPPPAELPAVCYNGPPGWPEPPEDWQPPVGWGPNPKWGPLPPDWDLWIDDDGNRAEPRYDAPTAQPTTGAPPLRSRRCCGPYRRTTRNPSRTTQGVT